MRLLLVLLSTLPFQLIHSQQLNIIPLAQQIKLSTPAVVSLSNLKVEKKSPSAYDNTIGEEGYRLKIDSTGIYITANTEQGYFYGQQTLQQFEVEPSLPCIDITDYPTYGWRGMHLDVSRHFFPVEVIKHYLDVMAQLKLNIFHWHLTDDQGWRIEIKKYPKLTSTGAWRIQKDGSKYGGFYTQQDIKEIVAYAEERHITIVPEIEMPGHSSAAISAYPELSCEPGEKTVPHTWGIKKDIYCPSDSTFQFLKDVLDEVCELFPGKYIHLGGDEAPKSAWKKNTTAQALIKKEHLKNEHELQHYFMQQIEQHIAAKGKQAIGWGEVMKGGVSDTMIVMSWIDKSAGKKAARKGNKVIMTPRFFCYFDYPQSLWDKRPDWWMTYLSLKKVYRFKPGSTSLTAEENKHIIGGQANVWTEHIPDEAKLQYHILPRLYAMAEALWHGNGNYDDFKKRLAALQAKKAIH